jgi:hypothetical protein
MLWCMYVHRYLFLYLDFNEVLPLYRRAEPVDNAVKETDGCQHEIWLLTLRPMVRALLWFWFWFSPFRTNA